MNIPASFSRTFFSAAVLAGFLFSACSTDTPDPEFTLTNSLSIDREEEPVVLTRDAIIDKVGEAQINDGLLPVPYLNGKALSSQVDDIDGDGEWDELAFLVNLDAESSQTITLQLVEEDAYPDFTTRTNVRFGVLDDGEITNREQLSMTADELPVGMFERFQMDGPAWENDKVGFRQYIDGRNGRDLYGKKSPQMALDTVGISDEGGLEDNYHVMLPWGRDILAVGNSLGLGGLAILRNNKPVRLGIRIDDERSNIDTTTYELLYEGPVRSSFRLSYEGWNTGTGKADLVNDVTIWAGQYRYTNTVHLESSNPVDTLLVGLVNIHNQTDPVVLDDATENYTAFYTHDQQGYDREWYIGMGLIFPDASYLDYRRAPDSGPGVTNSFLTMFELEGEKSLEYEAVAGWGVSDENFRDSSYFRNFMAEETRKVATPVIIE
ncbi:DUF4861 domain-containing protein [Gracilimonas mengyeensis]|uniref:DUF4861 domain-containing protein n=1 Tax=Gracilimonas mengyeensis TaxID=1302730 RepID=A0A521FE28_9BACT|nr:DUF4861 domain-containing protein [Gracilimonas mengyeensis]SMO94254.1 protein of unknown function [Gracilimonas mengyeensis]